MAEWCLELRASGGALGHGRDGGDLGSWRAGKDVEKVAKELISYEFMKVWGGLGKRSSNQD